MLDGLMRARFDPIWERIAAPLARAGLTPNQVTGLGTLVTFAVCAFYLLHRSSLLFAVTLTVAALFDGLDGAVARLRGMTTKAGGYFDAMSDRYQELAVLCVIAAVADVWPLAMLAFAGSVLTSYAKARAALETTVSNRGWPDLFERAERTVYLCVMLVVAGIVETTGSSSQGLLTVGMAVFALLTNITAIQRIMRAVKLLKQADGKGK